MSHTKKRHAGGMPAHPWMALLSVVAGVVLSAPGWAEAADAVDAGKLAAVQLAANAPGTIRFDSCARPAYPEEEAKQQHRGTVTLRFLVGADGRVKKALLVTTSGYPALDDAALVAISKCRFHPPLAGGKPVDAWIPVEFDWKPS